MLEKATKLDSASISKLLDQHGIMPTTQRVQIAQLMFARPQHLCADQVMQKLLDLKLRISKATVYNTLGLFAEKGIVHPVTIDPSRIIYDSNVAPHHHFYNKDSGELSDIHSDQIHISNLPDLPAGTEIDGMAVVIHLRKKS